MKTINKILVFFIALSMLGITACEKKYDTEGLSQITNYPVFEMAGDGFVIAPLGTPYVDPGVTANEAGTDIEVTVSVAGTFTGYSGTEVDSNTADKYVITYSAQNSDGFTGSTSRIVWITGEGDLVNSIEGLYTSTVVRDGTPSAQYENMAYILIYSTGNNTYGITDACGGYYSIGRAYGDDYAALGAEIVANDIPANDFTISIGVFPIWGNTIDMQDFTVDPANHQITYNGVADFGSVFATTLTQVQL
jgi:hypothetical protein